MILSKYWPEVFFWPYGAEEPIRFIPTEEDKRWLNKLKAEKDRKRQDIQKKIRKILDRLGERCPKETKVL